LIGLISVLSSEIKHSDIYLLIATPIFAFSYHLVETIFLFVYVRQVETSIILSIILNHCMMKKILVVMIKKN